MATPTAAAVARMQQWGYKSPSDRAGCHNCRHTTQKPGKVQVFYHCDKMISTVSKTAICSLHDYKPRT